MIEKFIKNVIAIFMVCFFLVFIYGVVTAEYTKPKTYRDGLIDGMRITVNCTIEMHDEGHTYTSVRKCFVDVLARLGVTVVVDDGIDK